MRFSKAVVKYRIPILILTVLLMIPAVIGIANTRINYDMLNYLPEDMDTTSELVAKYGIIEKAPVAKLALPKCNIVCITGAAMKDALSGYLDVLYQANPQSGGGALPGDDFYAFVENAEES